MHQETIQVPTIPGTPFEGGFYAGTISVGADVYALIVSPALEGTQQDEWHPDAAAIDSACSYSDGQANTTAMAEGGSRLAQAVRALTINGYSDWYIPSRDELEICYRNLKPLSRENACTFRDGDNPSSVPVSYPYTETLPAQTSAIDFQEGGAQAFSATWYWSSTQYAPGSRDAWGQHFSYGTQYSTDKDYAGRARAVRRFKI